MAVELKPEVLDALRKLTEHSRALMQALADLVGQGAYEFKKAPGREFMDREEAMRNVIRVRDAHSLMHETARTALIAAGQGGAQCPEDVRRARLIAAQAQPLAYDRTHLGHKVYVNDLVWALGILAGACKASEAQPSAAGQVFLPALPAHQREEAGEVNQVFYDAGVLQQYARDAVLLERRSRGDAATTGGLAPADAVAELNAAWLAMDGSREAVKRMNLAIGRFGPVPAKQRCGDCKGAGGVASNVTGVTVTCETCGGLGYTRAAPAVEVVVRQSQDERLAAAPLGTLAPACNGGGWLKTEGGWVWNGHTGSPGDTWNRPGGDWTGELRAPAAKGEPR